MAGTSNHVPTAEALLAVWEEGLRQPGAYRALMLLAAAEARPVLEDLADLPIGERNRRLLELHEALFGREVASVTRCPSCRERLDLQFAAAGLLTRRPPETGAGALSLETSGFRLTLRLPTSRDLLEIPTGQPGVARRWLAERSVCEASRRGRRVAASALPESAIRAIGRRLADADPQAVVELTLDCPACRHRWAAIFEIETFLWEEIDYWARRLLQDIHRLASAYGWGEAEILRLTPGRRQAYLEMVQA